MDIVTAGSVQSIDQGAQLLARRYAPAGELRAMAGDNHRSFQDVEYASLPGYRPLLLDLTVPTNRNGPVPVVVYLHPGAWLTGTHKPNSHYRCQNPILTCLPEAGLAVASVQYRLSAEARFPACMHDVAAAVRWLRRFAPELGLDPDRIGSWGESCGGHLSSMLAMNLADESMTGAAGVTGVPSTIRAAVSWYGVTDFLSLRAQALPGTKADYDAPDAPGSRLIGAAASAEPDRARRASPITWVSARAAPMLFVHGDDDHITPPRQSATLCAALAAADVAAELVMVPGAEHELKGVDFAPYLARSVAFLARELGADHAPMPSSAKA